MKKHIIFKGKPRTGKSLFANIIFGDKKTVFINGRQRLLDNDFLFDVTYEENWDFENVVIDDPRAGFDITQFYALISADEMLINRLNRKVLTVKTPRFIFLVDGETVGFLPECSAAFTQLFRVIDFNENTISDLMEFITEEKVIIKI